MLIGAHQSIAGGVSQAFGRGLEHRAEILSLVHQDDRLGACLDTCHLHAAGYDMTTARGYEAVLSQRL
ncbi:MAG TPA: hypothetical protein VE549_10915, partial [Myxococcaceae bacterium]|nr:hypothetical protein [Myxococcaceae bacterium]